jgi:5-formyltetrahydrofolate cyclo-ligase
MDKVRLRSTLRARRRALAPDQRAAAAHSAAALAGKLPLWRPGTRLAAYRANDGELDPEPLLRRAAADGLATCLPVVRGDGRLHFLAWSPGEPLTENRYGIGEPLPASSEYLPGQIDLLLMPLVAFSRDGTRLGMGAGYYDKTLAGERPRYAVGFAFACQEERVLPRDPWDVPLDYVLTECDLLRCAG